MQKKNHLLSDVTALTVHLINELLYRFHTSTQKLTGVCMSVHKSCATSRWLHFYRQAWEHTHIWTQVRQLVSAQLHTGDVTSTAAGLEITPIISPEGIFSNMTNNRPQPWGPPFCSALQRMAKMWHWKWVTGFLYAVLKSLLGLHYASRIYKGREQAQVRTGARRTTE